MGLRGNPYVVCMSLCYLFSLCCFPLAATAKPASCPTELEPLVEALLPELPGYINRELQRSRSAVGVASRAIDDPNSSSYVLLAGRPEFEPLPPGTARSTLSSEENTHSEVYQAFITTLERTYTDRNVLEFQGYHWLFLTPASSGWRLVTIFSSWGSYPDDGRITPPQNSSNGAVGQGIRTWLRDCRYSSLRPN